MQTTIHPFEAAGLGQAPFSFIGMSEKVYKTCPGLPERAAGTCDYCSTGIRYCCHIRSYDGKEFIVGTDCVRKIHQEDNKLVSDVEREITKLNQQKKEAERKAHWEAREQSRRAAEQAERDANGGFTLVEIAEQKRAAERDAARAKFEIENGWLISVLRSLPYSSEFASSMADKLERGPISGLSENCISILSDIFAKNAGGRRGSKAYKAKADEFQAKLCGEVK